jgi:hypothetical protein
MRALLAGVALLGMTGTARAEDPPPAPIPVAVKALEGCWRGAGEVMGKPVDITLAVKPAGLGTLVTVDADSRAKADPADRYAAHLTLAGRGPAPKDGPATGVSGFGPTASAATSPPSARARRSPAASTLPIPIRTRPSSIAGGWTAASCPGASSPAPATRTRLSPPTS